ncbi:hypothetical protein F5Y00DRAFT_256861 [Daldinia vernicosa]|uniref:uncharacterized protein n=1 Tax=Daldinia vernicosa TaxID=114800 RepID=UPI002007BF97|nr:uncharacterized protein F5Y00DRAFT_256861 [Daldinia vernicosa]KAI0854369.1 hypothetical protein F5Y00DRAFT_256861 [Daldinia vernicosa]
MSRPPRRGDSPCRRQMISSAGVDDESRVATSVRSFAAFKNCEDEGVDECSPLDILEKRSRLGAALLDAVSSPTTFRRIWEETEAIFRDRQPSRMRRPDSVQSNPERGRTGLISSTSPRESPSTETRSASSPDRSLLSRSTKSKENSSSTSPSPGDAIALPGLQSKGPREHDELIPLGGDEIDQTSFDLVYPCNDAPPQYSLEVISEALFSAEHLEAIINDQLLLERFASFLCVFKPKSVPLLVYYLDALKALKAIGYSNSIIRSLVSVKGVGLNEEAVISNTINESLLARLSEALQTLAGEDLPAYITHTWMQTVAVTIKQRITNTLPNHLQDLSEGLADVFCLIDPSRHDSPIVFASKEFHQMTQYGAGYVLGRNCRFLQGPGTSQSSARRIKEHLDAGKEHCEVLLNYRRDGSPFMNLVMAAPLLDNRGIIRYHISAQVDVSGLAKEYVGFESLRRIVDRRQHSEDASAHTSAKDEFRELAEMFTSSEMKIVQEVGGSTHRRRREDATGSETGLRHHGPTRVDSDPLPRISTASASRVTSLFEHYLLVRPHPHLRVLFASPSLRFPGMLQSSFMSRIGGPPAVREAVAQAFASGRGITTKVRWVTRMDSRGKSRWIHCTPLLGSNGAVGVWMVVLVDDDAEADLRRPRDAPRVDVKIDGQRPFDGCCPSSALASPSGDVEIEACTSGSSSPAHKKAGSTTI